MTKLIFLLLTLFPLAGVSQERFTDISDSVKCGNTTIFFKSHCAEKTDSVAFVHVHENETTAAEAANWFINSVKKGCFVTWKCQAQRFINFKLENKSYLFDPNRIYSDTGIKATLRLGGNYSDSAFLLVKTVAEQFVNQYIIGKKLIVALHNNSKAGSLSILSYKKRGNYSSGAKMVFINSKKDKDDFFYTTRLDYFLYFKNKGFNTILQDDNHVNDDGSLSVFCEQNHIPYINIEVQNGHLQQQKEMLKTLWLLLNELSNGQNKHINYLNSLIYCLGKVIAGRLIF